jgi:ankyrin repeat protein
MDLIDAINNNDVVRVQSLLQEGKSPNEQFDSTTPLMVAIEKKNEVIIRILLEHGADPNIADQAGDTPLMIAVLKEYPDIVNILLTAGANPNHKNEFGSTPIMAAAEAGNIPILELLISKGADMNVTNNQKYTLIMFGIMSGNNDVIKLLLKNGLDVNEQNTNGATALSYAVFKGKTEITKTLLEHGANPNNVEKNGDTPLMYAAESGYTDIVELLLTAGADPNTQNEDGVTPLLFAADKNNFDSIKLLLEHGADPNIANTINGGVPILYSIEQDNREAVQLLLSKGANPNYVTQNETIPLLHAIRSNKPEIFDILLNTEGIDVNIKSKIGTPLLFHVIDDTNDIQYIEKLIAKGADVNMKDEDYGITPLILAVDKNNKPVVELLLSKGANVNAQDPDGKSALWFAAEYGKTELVEVLLAQPGIQNTTDKDSKTLLEYALNNTFEAEINEQIKSKFEQANAPDTPWKGWTQSDVSRLDTIFGEPEVSNNFSCCPVCLKYVERSEACMYMKHDCRLEGYYHKDLYNKYKNEEGKICWCTICGRISKGHRHYKLRRTEAGKPNDRTDLLPGGDPFEQDCSMTSNGGGLGEKYVRFRQMVDTAHDLMEVEGLTKTAALNGLVEATWNSAVAASEIAKAEARAAGKNAAEVAKAVVPQSMRNNLVGKKPFRTNFPGNRVEAEAEVVVQEFARPEPNASNADLQPFVHESGMNFFSQAEDESNVIQFRHRGVDGKVYNHEESFISPESLEMVLENKIKNFGEKSSIYCWAYPTCGALLYPEEIKALVDKGLLEADLYERYKAMFNKEMTKRGMKGGRRRFRKTKKRGRQRMPRRHKQRGGEQEDFFTEAKNAECVIVPRGTRGGRRGKTRRGRRKGGRRGTRR